MAKQLPTAGGSGGGRTSGGITGKGGVKVNPVYKEVGPSVKVIKPGSKPLTQKTQEASVLNEEARIAASLKRLKALKEGRMQSW